jgi:hypothetical protein
MPTHVGASFPHDNNLYVQHLSRSGPWTNMRRWWGYTAVWNLLDYPGLVIPFGQVDQGRDVRDATYKPINEQDREAHELCEFGQDSMPVNHSADSVFRRSGPLAQCSDRVADHF